MGKTLRKDKITSTENIPAHSKQRGHSGRPIGASRPSRVLRSGDFVGRCQDFLNWHPFAGGFALVIATAVAVSGFGALVAVAVPSLHGWAICTPQNGAILALLLLARRKLWLWILLGYAAGLWQGERLMGSGMHYGALQIFGNLAEIGLAGLALPPFRSFKQWLQEPRLLPAFSAYAIVLGPLLMALAVAQSWTSAASFWSRVFTVAFAEALGMALATSLVLVLLNRDTYTLFRWPGLPQSVALFGLAGVSTWFAFHAATSVPLGVAALAVLLVIVFRLGLRAAVLGLGVEALVVIASGHAAGNPLSPTAATAQAFLALAVVVLLPLGVTLANKQFLAERLSDAQGELDKLKSLDRLTGIPNRKRFDLVLDREWQRATRDGKSIALVMVDVDDFDQFNQHYGAAAGDECLRRVAARMSDLPHRAYDLISRYDGGRFSVLLPGASGEAVERIAEEFRSEIAAQDWSNEKSPFGRVTVSVGWAAMIPNVQTRPAAIITAAENALLRAHDDGKNCVQGWVEVIEAS